MRQSPEREKAEVVDADEICLNEDINMSSFLNEVNKIKESLDYLVEVPERLEGVVRVMKHNGKIYGIMINTNTEPVDGKGKAIWIKNGIDQPVCGKLTGHETIRFDGKTVKRENFSFHFEAAEENSLIKTFRIDMKKEQSPPLHAHDDDYKTDNNNRHLTYPEDTDLNLQLIDFCTIMHVLATYMKHPDKYPLSNGEFYNDKIRKIRSRYDNANK